MRLPSPEVQLLEEIVALVVDDDEGGKVQNLDPPHRLHAEFGIFEHLDLSDAVLREAGGRPANRAEVESAVPGARFPHLGRAVALGEHHHRSAGRLELVDERIHSPRRRRPERARRHALRRLGGPA